MYRFIDSQNGYGPFITLTIDKAGNLYETAKGGSEWGVICKLAPTGDGKWTYSVLHTFTDGKDDGAEPFAPMIFDNNEKHLYGTTAYGGAYNSGTVFEMTP